MLLWFTLTAISMNGQFNTEYNKLVNQAELAIISKDFGEALKNYNEIKKQNYIYSREINNALMCANKLEDWKQVNFWAELLLKKGATIKFFNQERFKDYRKTSFYNTLQNTVIENKINKDLIKSLDSLKSIDQGLFVKLKTDPNVQVYNLTEEIDKKLFLLEKKYGKISEENIGINIKDATTYYFTSEYAVLYRHSYQSHKDNSFFNEKLKNNELDRLTYYSSIDYGLMPIVNHHENLYFLKENMLKPEYKEDLSVFMKVAKVAYKNDALAGFSFYFPIMQISSFRDEQSEKSFNEILDKLYTK